MNTIRTVAIMALAPPLLLFGVAHAGVVSYLPVMTGYALFVLAWALGIAAVATSGWPPLVKAWVAVAYTLAAMPGMPFLGLLAVCSTGNCL